MGSMETTALGLLIALGASTVGLTTQFLAAVPAAVSSGPDLTAWLQGGGSAAAVAGLVYVARMVVKGDLVPRAVSEREKATEKLAAEAEMREAKFIVMAHESMDRERRLDTIINTAITATTLHTEIDRQVQEELRWWRERRAEFGK